VFSDALQLYQGINKDVRTIKSQIVPTFRLLVGATFVSTSASSSAKPLAAATSYRAAVPRESSELLRADDTEPNEADVALELLAVVVDRLSESLQEVPPPDQADTCSGFAAFKLLFVYGTLLNVFVAFAQDLSVFSTQAGANTFIASYNNAVDAFNAAIARSNALAANGRIIVH
jgi:hypothetical protein